MSAAAREVPMPPAASRRSVSPPRALLVALLLTLPLVTPRLRGADEIEYFAYLRSAVFDHDLEFGNEYAHFHALDPQGLAGFKATFLDLREPATGRHINFAPLGTALVWAPAYLLAHAGVSVARALGAEVAADGFSKPYVVAVCYASWAYGVAGLLLLHRTLLRYGPFGAAAAWATAAMLWATPVLYYLTVGPGFSHAASLFVVSLLLWLTLRAREDGFPLGRVAALGVVGGLAALVREQDGLLLVVPAALIAGEGLRAKRVGTTVARLAVLGMAAVLTFTPQLLAYHAVNGRFGPSRLVARKMSYASPHAFAVLFDPGHGLFAWTPLLVLAAAGLVLAAVRSRRTDVVPLALLLALLLQVWINGSVESWTQAGAFGSRRFVSATPIFAWGLAALMAAVLPRLGRPVLGAAVVLFAWWNASLMVQFGLKIMDRQQLEWPRVATSQVTEVPRRLSRSAWLFFTDRERLVRETR